MLHSNDWCISVPFNQYQENAIVQRDLSFTDFQMLYLLVQNMRLSIKKKNMSQAAFSNKNLNNTYYIKIKSKFGSE